MKETTRYLVVLREYERGWGSKDFVAHEYDDYESAREYANSVNAENNLDYVPDYYINARIITNPQEFRIYEDLV